MKKNLDRKPDLSMPVGKGATVQRFTANFGDERREIDTEPWVEGELTAGQWHVVDEKNSGDAFRDLEAIAEEVEKQTPRPIAKNLRRQQPK